MLRSRANNTLSTPRTAAAVVFPVPSAPSPRDAPGPTFWERRARQTGGPRKGPPRRRHQNGLEKTPFQPLVPTPDSGRERAGGGPFGSGPRRQPAAEERRRLRRCWQLSVPSPGRCYLQSPKQSGPAPSVLSAPHAPSGRRVAPAHLRRLRRELPHWRSRAVLGGGPRCLRLESVSAISHGPGARRPGGISERSRRFFPARGPLTFFHPNGGLLASVGTHLLACTPPLKRDLL